MRHWRTPPGVRRVLTEGRYGALHYRIAAPAQPAHVPLVCFHLTPNSGRVYSQFLAAIGTDRIAVAPDTPGFGLSTAPAIAPRIADYATSLGELADELAARHGFAQFDVMGYHTGSKIALTLAQQRPAQVRRVVLVSAPVYTPEELQSQRRHLAGPAPAEWPADGASLVHRWREHWAWKDGAAGPWFVQREVAEGLANGCEAWRAYGAAFDVQHAELLPRTSQPVLLLCPADDLEAATLRAEPLLKHGRFVRLPEWGHGFLDVHTADAARLVREFLDAGSARPARPLTSPPAGTAAHRHGFEPATNAAVHRPRGIRRAFHDGPYGPLHYRLFAPAQAAQPPLVLFHMSPNSGRVFEALLPEMGRDRVVVAPDTPGFGESEAPPAPVDIVDYAAALAGLIDALGHPRVDVLGYHTGAITCIALALARPDLVRRIVQISSPVFTDDELAELRREYRGREPREDGTHLADAWTNLQRFYTDDVPRTVLQRNFVEGLRGGPAAPWGHRAAFAHDLRADLPKVQQPVLIVNPDDDLSAQSPRGLALLPHGRIVNLHGRAHGFMDVMTAEFGTLLRGFLDEKVPGDGSRF